jgi:3-oxoacyl-[acyl-carrier-protein] synthase II
MTEPIVVSCFSQLSPLGLTIQEMDQSFLNNDTKATSFKIEIEGIDADTVPIFQTKIDTNQVVAPSKLPLDRCTALALLVSQAAFKQADLNLSTIDHHRLGIFWGSGMSGAGSFDLASASIYRDHKRIRPTTVITAMPNAPAGEIALMFQAYGASITYCCACASSAVAIGEAYWALRSGRIDVAIVGGSEAMLTPGVVASWQALRVLSKITDTAHNACRPFDSQRNGFTLGEGAGAIILETHKHATQRGHQPKLALSGYATNCDGAHITNPNVEGQIQAMSLALNHAKLKAKDIGYLNAHGTATQAGDLCEAQSIASVFKDTAVAVSSTKGLHGHLLGAGGAVELIVALRALQTQLLPANAHLRQVDPKIHLDLIQGQSRSTKNLKHVMSNSFAFGGTNAVLIASLID